MRKGASLAARQTEPADVEVLNIAASTPILKKKCYFQSLVTTIVIINLCE